jgi:hypothetical protein
MIVKLNNQQYEFLNATLGKERADLFEYLANGNGVALEINDEIVVEISDWAGEKIQKSLKTFLSNVKEIMETSIHIQMEINCNYYM